MRAKEFTEGADFLGYYKKDERTWSFPDGMKFNTPHRSNHAARTILQALGLKATRNYIEKNQARGPGTDEEMYKNVYMYDQEALRFKAKHPEITHVAFA